MEQRSHSPSQHSWGSHVTLPPLPVLAQHLSPVLSPASGREGWGRAKTGGPCCAAAPSLPTHTPVVAGLGGGGWSMQQGPPLSPLSLSLTAGMGQGWGERPYWPMQQRRGKPPPCAPDSSYGGGGFPGQEQGYPFPPSATESWWGAGLERAFCFLTLSTTADSWWGVGLGREATLAMWPLPAVLVGGAVWGPPLSSHSPPHPPTPAATGRKGWDWEEILFWISAHCSC